MDTTSLTIGATIEVLKILANIGGGWGMSIILLTLIVRFLLWPFNVSQQRSMKKMQALQPKLKLIQERYKNKPEEMQKKMMEFYKENQFNPMAGCLPLLLQLPVFILLYTALMSPQFISLAGKSNFLFVSGLDATIRGNAGVSYDGSFSAGKYDKFVTGKVATVQLKNGETLEKIKILQPNKAIEVQGEINPGDAIDLKISLDNLNLKFAELDMVESAKIMVTDIGTKEAENVEFKRNGSILTASVPTNLTKETIHYDVIALVVIFGLTMFLSTKIMTATNKNQQQDPAQAAMQKSMGTFMPIMVIMTFVFIPIPAGVLLYLVTSNIFQIVQTIVINKQIEKEEAAKKEELLADSAKVIEAKEIKNTKD